ncbi:F0F1 ATP synthase subunit [Psychromonas sp. MB-3u-54]|uniref:AtpZ/AtpI family protein n=1 Tax=Psychromonas sp. MB-3u-54 TaxID=2058319 RepID=UPI000C3395D3|nr:AtpZ/AtpI family protein [Psychromonas sp. MB-3u-54]PKH03958.1 F0F1 ATP synthase subunit [Psychromonas sp. MB-3u-54]
MNVKSDKKSTQKMASGDKAKKMVEPEKKEDFVDLVGLKTTRKMHARRNPTPGMWFGLGMMGLIGWSVVVPTLLGLALGLWLDSHSSGPRSWTLALLVAGLILGCFNAWYWVDKEQQAMRDDQEHQDE